MAAKEVYIPFPSQEGSDEKKKLFVLFPNGATKAEHIIRFYISKKKFYDAKIEVTRNSENVAGKFFKNSVTINSLQEMTGNKIELSTERMFNLWAEVIVGETVTANPRYSELQVAISAFIQSKHPQFNKSELNAMLDIALNNHPSREMLGLTPRDSQDTDSKRKSTFSTRSPGCFIL